VPAGAAAARDAELAAHAARYFDAFTNSEPVLTRDGSRVVFVSTRDGLPQLYIADAADPRAVATRLVTTAQRVTDPVPTADGRALLFRSDTGGDEQWSIFRVGLDGQGLIDLTPGERLNRDSFAVPDGAPELLLFSARSRSEARSTLYVASAVAAAPARAIYTDDKPAFLADVAPDGRAAIVRRYPTHAENYLIRVDVATGGSRSLYPAAGARHSIYDAAYSADGRQIYVLTDLGGDQAAVLALDATTGKELARRVLAPPTAQPVAISVAPRGGLIAVSLIAGTRSALQLLDGRALTPAAPVALPPGQGGAARFSADGARLVAQWSTPRTPTDLYAIDARTGKVSPLRREPRPSLPQPPAIESTTVEIPAAGGHKIPTNVYLPPGEATRPHPTLVL
jgi:dipeptidyl aminopeptidase/acylaminoacyl peptidase